MSHMKHTKDVFVSCIECGWGERLSVENLSATIECPECGADIDGDAIKDRVRDKDEADFEDAMEMEDDR